MDDPQLVEHLYRARRTSGEVEVSGTGLDLQRALEVQLAVADRFETAGDVIGGWKVGLTSGPARDLMGEGVRPFGYVLASRILRSGSQVALDAMGNTVIEAELCLIMRSDLQGAGIEPEDAREAVESVAAAFELNELRVRGGADAEHATLVADGLGAWGMVVGDAIPAETFTPGTSVEVRRDGDVVASETMGADVVMDDPFVSLARLARSLSEHGRRIEAGQPVLTGAFVGLPVDGPGEWSAEFSGIGVVAVRLT